jgi:hypothetical protein
MPAPRRFGRGFPALTGEASSPRMGHERKGVEMQKPVLAAAIALAALVLAPAALADVRITDQAYVRHDGGTDMTIASCSSDVTDPTPDAPTPTPAADEGGGERQQNEPTTAVDPSNPNHMTAGANDYCSVPTTTDSWAGFYYSANGGASWTNSLLPGYPTDTSTEGQASPLHGLVTSAGDPVQDWDRAGHVYYGGIAFNRAKPANGSIWVARYNWGPPFTVPDYEFTTLVSRGTPTPIFKGHFEDKIELEADDGVSSPFAGNVYVCWARFTGSGVNNVIELARSTDGGRTWERQKISEAIHGVQGCDIAVTRTGTVFVTWRQYAFTPGQSQRQADAIAWAKSTDGGRTFTKPAIAHEFIHWDMEDQSSSPVASGQARYDACLAGDGTLGACESPEPRATERDCGDGPLVCRSGYVFGRVDSSPRNAADPVAGEGDELYIVVEATVPGTQRPSLTTYGTVDEGIASQASIYFTKTENGGASWTPLVRIDPQAKGNQFYPDIDANGGRLHAMWQDTRASTATGPDGSWITVPFENQWVAANPPGATSSGPGVQSFYATAAASGGAWTITPASSVVYKLNWEQFSNRDVPFFGDYNYISAVGTKVLMAWADGRDTVAGTDPRYTNGDGTDGFDVLQCRTFNATTMTWSADNCPNAGGLDQQIWGLVLG